MVEPVIQYKKDAGLVKNLEIQSQVGLSRALDSFENTRGDWMRRLSLRIGSLQKKYYNNPLGRFFLKHFTTRIIAWLVVRFGILEIGKKRAKSAPELVYDWLKLAKFFHAPVHVESSSGRQVVVCHNECTMGFKPGQGKLCRASMNMDVEIIRRLGGKMTIEYSIAEGADHCRHVIDFPTKQAAQG